MVLTVLLNNGAVRSCCRIRRQGPGLETRKEESGLFHNCPWGLLHLWKMWVQLQVSLPLGSWATTSGGQSLKARSRPRSPPGPGGCRSPLPLPGSLRSAGKPCDFHSEGEEGRGQGESREGGGTRVSRGLLCTRNQPLGASDKEPLADRAAPRSQVGKQAASQWGGSSKVDAGARAGCVVRRCLGLRGPAVGGQQWTRGVGS